MVKKKIKSKAKVKIAKIASGKRKIVKRVSKRKRAAPKTDKPTMTVVIPGETGQIVEADLARKIRKVFVGCQIEIKIIERKLENWSVLHQAETGNQSSWVYLVTGKTLDLAIVKNMLTRMENADLILAQRRPMPMIAAWVFRIAWRFPNIELGSDVLIKAGVLSELSGRYSKGDTLLGLRMVRTALASGQRVVTESVLSGEAPLSTFSALGIHAGYFKKFYKNNIAVFVAGFLLVFLGTDAVHPKNATIGLVMISFGMLLLASLIGKQE